MAHRGGSRLYELDLLRLVAALMVVGHHYLGPQNAVNRVSQTSGPIFDHGPTVSALATLGLLGVEIFFVISGFVIANSAVDRGPVEFVRSRLLRLLPAFWFCCLLTWCALRLDPAYRAVSVPQLLANLFFVARPLGNDFVDGVYWSLVIELRFYALVAVLLALRAFDRFHLFLAVWLAVAMADRLGLGHRLLQVTLLPQFAPFFIVGGALHLLRDARRPRFSAALLTLATALACERVYERMASDPALGFASVAVLLLAIGCIAAAATGRSARLGLPWMATAGALTYPLYLLHQDLGFLFMRHLPWFGNGAAITLLALPLFLLLAQAVVRLVERPVQAAWRGAASRTTVTPAQLAEHHALSAAPIRPSRGQ